MLFLLSLITFRSNLDTSSLNVLAVLQLHQLVDASTLKKEVAEGVDLMVVRELTGGNRKS